MCRVVSVCLCKYLAINSCIFFTVMSACQDQSVPVENGSVADTSGPPTKRQREDEVPVAVPMVLPLPQWTVPASKESHDCVNVVRGCAEQYFNAELARVDKTRLINSSIGECQ